MEAIKLLNEAVDARLVLQLVTDSDDDFYYREYYLVSRGKEQILLLSSNEEYYDGNLEIIRTEDKFLRSFQKSPYLKSHLDILPNYADYSISGGDLFFLDFLEQDFVKQIEGYHEDCFSQEDRKKAIGFTSTIPLLKEKARNNIGNYTNYKFQLLFMIATRFVA